MPAAPKTHDLLGLTFVSDPRISPAGDRVAVVVTRIVTDDGPASETADESVAACRAAALGETARGGRGKAKRKSATDDGPAPKAPRYRSRIHLFDLAAKRAGAPSQGVEFTRSDYADRAPRFSPDGSRLAFLSTREEKGKPQLYVMPLAGGEPAAITDLPAGVEEFCWHPDGERIAFTSRGAWKDEAAAPGWPRRIAREHFKFDGAGFIATEPAQVYLVRAGGGNARKLTDLAEDARWPAFAPDGKTLYLFTPANAEAEASMRTDLVALDPRTRATKALVPGILGAAQVVPSPDGDQLAYLANLDQEDLSSGSGAWVVVAGGGTPRLLTGHLEASPSAGGDSRYGAYPNAPVWTGDGDALYVNVNREGASGLVRVDLGGAVTTLQEGTRVVTTFAAGPTGASAGEPGDGAPPRFAFVAETPSQPGELYLREPDGTERRLGAFHDEWLKGLTLRAPEGPFDAAGAKVDEEIPYWVMRPARARKDRAAVLQVHGGPHTNYGYGFQFEFQLMAARGYAVVYGNPRGGSSYGHAFATSILGRYGGIDADDVLAIADAGLAHLDTRDAPLHLTGGSYGGFMTNWLVGQVTRFRSAVTQRSICNWTSMYGTSDIGPRFVERELQGVPWGDPEALWRQSPIRYAEKVTTPLLIIHSEEDHRCPIEQAEQFFTVLKRLGKAETEFVRFPGEGHELSRSGRPDRRIARLEAIVDWFERHA
ncbi:MAG: S9 family peptidase [Trueperaceae bacterium]